MWGVVRRLPLRALCFGLLCASSATADAAEGFFTDRQPAAVRQVWPSVFAFVCEGRGIRYVATAFVVRRTPRGKKTDYEFVTAGHAVEDCKAPRRYLVEDFNQQRFEADGITLAAPLLKLTDISVVYVDDTYDIAVIRASAPAKAAVGAPLAVNAQCNRALRRPVYAIGFPGVTQRSSLRKLREQKRWSGGEYVGLGSAEFRGAEEIYIASNVDSLPGSSGGPVIDEAGTLIGVVAKGAAAPENGFRYDVDPKKPADWQTFLVPCEAVLRIFQRSGIASARPEH